MAISSLGPILHLEHLARESGRGKGYPLESVEVCKTARISGVHNAEKLTQKDEPSIWCNFPHSGICGIKRVLWGLRSELGPVENSEALEVMSC